MSMVILYWGLYLSQFFLSLAMILALFRLVRGPRAQDRIVGLDALYMTAILLFLTFDIRSGTTIYFEAVLIISLLGPISSIALAKFLMRGEIIE
ncbi:multisubunit potassium/proton antiporter, PhaF subunit [Bartonella sp. CDC_skunk]|uniref:K+/H+ antiporter subunit F n=1 Tax=unclassified Bartonella TaxID=2645622 RepID=UPI0001F4C86B|nr:MULTISPECIES: K+/H+ antiporter subunit F [unclassified Bartonella]AQX22015.1 multisubunit potassium/proton antiporter, PhaF subunit [Bartonella sp. CDC_skunk]AQX22232.1 multisubunit potassium/proton antiporter, PhaF subunit [Bartonella sp. 11B]AQX24485.1 multisubunit potassium/proton antiporter, PhaF subunit [Bartonella sp. 114]AQX26001.1 multisubunit potassium/proton antiporter, PhaF subunit [Bartonella sp. Coyote22sub2]AQX27289.1 multisubunit potassium/proton antiporter, PhaF subunit [Bar